MSLSRKQAALVFPPLIFVVTYENNINVEVDILKVHIENESNRLQNIMFSLCMKYVIKYGPSLKTLA